MTVTTNGSDALAAVDSRWPDLILLDLVLPDMPGERVAAEIKRRADLPIMVLSAVSDRAVKAAMIQDFAEDYVTRPYYYPELRARIDRVLSRMANRVPAQEVVVGDGLVLVLGRREALVDGRRVKLTPIEARVLGRLAATLGRPVTTDQLLEHVWADSDGADPVYVWVAMRRLRQKLEPVPGAPRYIHTVRGSGYRLGDHVPDPTSRPRGPSQR